MNLKLLFFHEIIRRESTKSELSPFFQEYRLVMVYLVIPSFQSFIPFSFINPIMEILFKMH